MMTSAPHRCHLCALVIIQAASLFVFVHSFSLQNGCFVTRRPITTAGLFSSSSDLSSSSFPTHGSSAVRSIRPTTTDSDVQLQLLSFYRFIPVSNPESVRDAVFEQLLLIPGVKGSVYVAKEGINAQFACPVGESLQLLLKLFGKEGCLPFDLFEKCPPNMGDVVDSSVSTFDRLIVRTRDYILRDGMALGEGDASLDWSDAGFELDAKEWHEQLQQQQNVQLIDCRNDYESDLGTFQSAKPLNTKTFSETWSVLDDQVKSDSINTDKPVYIYCTGGIRCIKVGWYLKNKLGCKDVRSLRHGIIGYEKWATATNNQSLWKGDNFLFDKRRFSKESSGNPEHER
jgi:UPF0176 protein